MIDKFDGEYFFLSNFYTCPVTIGGITYKNAEAAFHSFKATEERDKKLLSKMSPKEAKHYGRKLYIDVVHWDKVRVRCMAQVLDAKFKQNPDLKAKLIATEPEALVEGNTWNDVFWGRCEGVGLNTLGNLLMALRAKFIAEQSGN